MKKKPKNGILSKWEKIRNKVISKTRYKVERTFGFETKLFASNHSKYTGLRKSEFQQVFSAIAHNLYRTPNIILKKGIL